MREIDKRAIEKFEISGIILMENAALQTYRIIENLYACSNNILILAGCGNNGGDGLALARILHSSGKNMEVILFASESELIGDAKLNFKIVQKLNIPIKFLNEEIAYDEAKSQIKTSISHTQLIVDALFGTGLSRPLEGHFKVAVDTLNCLVHASDRKIPVISLDIPSGINGENGSVLGSAILASDTVTFGYPKMGHFLYPGKMHTGRLHVVPISLPPKSAESAGVSIFTMNERDAAIKLKKRLPWGHKGTFGKVAVIAGSTGMTGAACLTASAALKSGAGIVTVGIPSSLNPILENKLTEVMTYPLKDTGLGSLSRDCIKDIPDFLRDKDVLAIGPGLGKEDDIYDILEYILAKHSIPIVLDADGLNHISRNLRLLIDYKAPVVITPHPGEMARLTGMTVEEVSLQPVEVALDFAKKTNVTVLLKGAASIVANPQGEVYINNTGNCGMATAGSGDVLTGIIAGLIAQKYEAYDAAVLGTFMHGLAGDEAANGKGQDSLTALDILENIPLAIKKLRLLQ
jgi:NAD(P)H-hydrate epimerase